MIITLNNTSGLITKRVQLGRTFYNLIMLYNHRDDCWYLSINGYLDSKRIIKNRILFSNNDGYLVANGDVEKLTFKQLTWVSYV
jgi:hypothetical protein